MAVAPPLSSYLRPHYSLSDGATIKSSWSLEEEREDLVKHLMLLFQMTILVFSEATRCELPTIRSNTSSAEASSGSSHVDGGIPYVWEYIL